eukprot:PhM_4_TR13670/c3_g1_i1/m.19355
MVFTPPAHMGAYSQQQQQQHQRSSTPTHHTSSSFYRNVRDNFSHAASIPVSVQRAGRASTSSSAVTTNTGSYQQPQPTQQYDPPSVAEYATAATSSTPPPQYVAATTEVPSSSLQPQPAVPDDIITPADIDAASTVEYAGGIALCGAAAGQQQPGQRLPTLHPDVLVRFTPSSIGLHGREDFALLLDVPLGELCELSEDVGVGALQLELRNARGTALLELVVPDGSKRVSMYKVLCARKTTWERTKGVGLVPNVVVISSHNNNKTTNMHNSTPYHYTHGPDGYNNNNNNNSVMNTSAADATAPSPSILDFSNPRGANNNTNTPSSASDRHRHHAEPRPIEGWTPPLVVNKKPITPEKY